MVLVFHVQWIEEIFCVYPMILVFLFHCTEGGDFLFLSHGSSGSCPVDRGDLAGRLSGGWHNGAPCTTVVRLPSVWARPRAAAFKETRSARRFAESDRAPAFGRKIWCLAIPWIGTHNSSSSQLYFSMTRKTQTPVAKSWCDFCPILQLWNFLFLNFGSRISRGKFGIVGRACFRSLVSAVCWEFRFLVFPCMSQCNLMGNLHVSGVRRFQYRDKMTKLSKVIDFQLGRNLSWLFSCLNSKIASQFSKQIVFHGDMCSRFLEVLHRYELCLWTSHLVHRRLKEASGLLPDLAESNVMFMAKFGIRRVLFSVFSSLSVIDCLLSSLTIRGDDDKNFLLGLADSAGIHFEQGIHCVHGGCGSRYVSSTRERGDVLFSLIMQMFRLLLAYFHGIGSLTVDLKHEHVWGAGKCEIFFCNSYPWSH